MTANTHAHAPPAEVNPAALTDLQAIEWIEAQVNTLKCTHCGGTGKEPLPSIRPTWRATLLELFRSREQRECLKFARNTGGQDDLYRVYAEMRRAMQNASALGIPQALWAVAAGLSRARVSDIYRGKVGFPTLPPAQRPPEYR